MSVQKKVRKDTAMMFFSAGMIIGYLAVTIPLLVLVKSFTTSWFVFGLIAVCVPVLCLYLYAFMVERTSMENSEKKKLAKELKENVLRIWLFDLLYMAIFNNWIIFIYVFGIIAILVIFYNLSKVFLSNYSNKIGWSMIVDFVMGIAITVWLICKIEDNDIRIVITTILAAVFGGLLTLIGVAWSIKSQEKARKEEEKSKCKPMFRFFGRKAKISECNLVYCYKNLENETSNYDAFFYPFKNFDNANFSINNVEVNGIKFFPTNDSNIEKNEVFIIYSYHKKDDFVKSFKISVKDILGNNYEFKLVYDNQEPKYLKQCEGEN